MTTAGTTATHITPAIMPVITIPAGGGHSTTASSGSSSSG